LGFSHHVSPAGTCLFDELFGFSLRLRDDFLALLLTFGAQRVGRRNRLGSNCLRLTIRPFAAVRGGAVGGVQNLRGFHTKRLGNAAGFQPIVGHILYDGVFLGQPALQFVAESLEPPDLGGSGAQARLHLGGVESATDCGKRRLL
jgi:hypothetical protein